MKIKLTVSDTITLFRTQEVTMTIGKPLEEMTDDELIELRDAAITKAEHGRFEETEDDNTPWRVEYDGEDILG